MKDIIDSIIRSLKDINGLEAIVLGGSRAKGTHGPDSDIDIGLYYNKVTISRFIALIFHTSVQAEVLVSNK